MNTFEIYAVIVSIAIAFSIISTAIYFMYNHYRDSTVSERYWKNMYRAEYKRSNDYKMKYEAKKKELDEIKNK